MISDLQRPTNSGFGQKTEPSEILNNIILDNKNIIITGGYSGIGLETTKALRSAGARTIIPAKRKDIAQAELKDIVPEEDIFEMDLADLNSVKKFTNSFHDLNINLDILINNAGSLINRPFAQTTIEDFKNVYNTNVFGVAELTRRVIPFMGSSGHVVNISSMGGVQGSAKFAGLSVYSSSKGALISLTELLAEEYKDIGPSFNVLALGAVQTEMLEAAFPGFKAPMSAKEMAAYIFEFSKTGQQFYNGKLLQVSSSTP